MNKLSQILLGVLMCVFQSVAYADEPVSQSRAEYILQKVVEADMLCAKASLPVSIEIDASGVRGIKERPIVLCAYSEATKTWHTITLALQYPVPLEYISCVKSASTLSDRKNCVLPLRVVTDGYRIEHLKGYGITRFIVNAYFGDEKLTVYRTRHMWFDDDALASKDVERIVSTAKGINYTPHHPDFDDPELVQLGARFLFERVQEARVALQSVQSHAFPARSLADVVPWEIPMALAIIEQMDDKTFFGDKKQATDSVLIEYALMQHEAFRWAQSGANAIGPLQFTAPTYASMVREYPLANLDQSFEGGARNLANVLRASICLIDKEVAQFPASKPIFLRNPKLGGAFPVAAYNGGPIAANALYVWLRKNKVSIEEEEIDLPTTFVTKRIQKCPCKNMTVAKGKKKRTVSHVVVRSVNSETPGYLEKYFYLLNYLVDQGLE